MALRLLSSLFLGWHDSSEQPVAQRRKFRPRLEQLEDRVVPVTGVTLAGANALVKNLVGNGIVVKSVSYTGNVNSAGLFTGGKGSVKIASGVVLSTGNAVDVKGPNTGNSSTDLGGPGDTDLNNLINNTDTYDATVLEFTFIPKGPNFSFQYVFGSDEYNEDVNSSFNDVFAFFVNGKNVAKIPGTNLPVSINNLNNGEYSQFFVDNESNTHNVAMDGYTTVLPISLKVTPNTLNTIKLAIQDVGDGSLDSWVLIKAGSLSAPSLKIYRPIAYSYNAAKRTYSGELTVVSSTPMKGPIYIIFPSLPPGVRLVNAAGYTSTGKPYIVIKGNLPPRTPIRLPIVFRNPQRVNLTSFFKGFPVEFAGSVT
ncbi:MAG: hypothetical protein FJ271_30555 [Planctomycetes bacterium]|nr:hypothetical protein [Planctomycetota bacterium]